MKQVVCAVALVMLALGGGVVADDGEGYVTMTGAYVWARGERDITGDIKAVFTPTGENTWDVSFHFDWEDEPRIWTGSAKGSLSSGRLEGEVLEDRDRKRTFRFKGAVDDGKFEGEHGQVRDGELSRRGTISLAAE